MNGYLLCAVAVRHSIKEWRRGRRQKKYWAESDAYRFDELRQYIYGSAETCGHVTMLCNQYSLKWVQTSGSLRSSNNVPDHRSI